MNKKYRLPFLDKAESTSTRLDKKRKKLERKRRKKGRLK